MQVVVKIGNTMKITCSGMALPMNMTIHISLYKCGPVMRAIWNFIDLMKQY